MLRFQNGCNKVVIEFHVVQFWSEIILVISNRTRAERLSTRMISDQIGNFRYIKIQHDSDSYNHGLIFFVCVL